MHDTVECPYCDHENDMSDGLTDLPDNNKLDHECENCEKEFEVEVEFEPNYSSNKIVYENCERCGSETRDICKKGKIFPYPEQIQENKLCTPCFLELMGKQYEREDAEYVRRI